MNIQELYADPAEQPLDHLVADGGYCGIFHTIGCIGDSLASGEFESMDEKGMPGFHDMYEYSWGQCIARTTGAKVWNFSCGGMSARHFWESFGKECGCFVEENICQAYIIALGVNDRKSIELGSVNDINDQSLYQDVKDTFAGYYSRIMLRLKKWQPQARFFLMTMPRSEDKTRDDYAARHAQLLHQFAEHFDYTYVLDFYRYAPVYDEEFRKHFYLGGHLNPMGYMLTAKMTMSYMDYIIRHNMEDFAQVGFIGKPYHNCRAKW